MVGQFLFGMYYRLATAFIIYQIMEILIIFNIFIRLKAVASIDCPSSCCLRSACVATSQQCRVGCG